MQKHATAPAVKALLFSERTPPRAPRACTAPLLARPGDTARPGGGEIRARSEARPRYRPAMDDADGYFGERVAATYDDPSSEEFDPAVIERTADVLAGLAGPRLGSSGRALELGIGTGRIALPLARRGVPVHGIDMSRAMVAPAPRPPATPPPATAKPPRPASNPRSGTGKAPRSSFPFTVNGSASSTTTTAGTM